MAGTQQAPESVVIGDVEFSPAKGRGKWNWVALLSIAKFVL
jgi:hypothetical protein